MLRRKKKSKPLRITEALEKAYQEFGDGYLTVQVSATRYDDGTIKVKWQVYTSELGWGSKAKTLELAIKRLKEEAENRDYEDVVIDQEATE